MHVYIKLVTEPRRPAMKLKNISCTQFAGVRDINVNLTDGINVIYGKNESGKSTLLL